MGNAQLLTKSAYSAVCCATAHKTSLWVSFLEELGINGQYVHVARLLSEILNALVHPLLVPTTSIIRRKRFCAANMDLEGTFTLLSILKAPDRP